LGVLWLWGREGRKEHANSIDENVKSMYLWLIKAKDNKRGQKLVRLTVQPEKRTKIIIKFSKY
jgi:hypothetical protein